MQTTYMELQT